MNPKFAAILKIASASIATIVTCVLIPILAPGNQRHPPALIIASAIIMTCAGWLYTSFKIRIIGIIHAIFMLVVGGYLLSLGLPFFFNPPGMRDNAAAGMIALANLTVTMAGAAVFASGVTLTSLVFMSDK